MYAPPRPIQVTIYPDRQMSARRNNNNVTARCGTARPLPTTAAGYAPRSYRPIPPPTRAGSARGLARTEAPYYGGESRSISMTAAPYYGGERSLGRTEAPYSGGERSIGRTEAPYSGARTAARDYRGTRAAAQTSVEWNNWRTYVPIPSKEKYLSDNAPFSDVAMDTGVQMLKGAALAGVGGLVGQAGYAGYKAMSG